MTRIQLTSRKLFEQVAMAIATPLPLLRLVMVMLIMNMQRHDDKSLLFIAVRIWTLRLCANGLGQRQRLLVQLVLRAEMIEYFDYHQQPIHKHTSGRRLHRRRRRSAIES